jgi:hypothetical protein
MFEEEFGIQLKKIGLKMRFRILSKIISMIELLYVIDLLVDMSQLLMDI